MADQHEGYFYPVVESGQNTPCKVLHHITMFVLAGTVVSMEAEVDFPKVVMGEEVVQEADGTVPTLTNVDGLVDEVIVLHGK